MNKFDKNPKNFPIKNKHIFINNCGVSPLFKAAADEISTFITSQVENGALVFNNYTGLPARFRKAASSLLKTDPKNITLISSTAEAMSIIANGYPLKKGDEIVSYIHEYPSNHYAWKLQETRGAVLKLLADRDLLGGFAANKPRAWSMEDLKGLVSKRTKIIAVSHVQFTSGFAADLKELGAFCKAHEIDLVIDVAQSLGSLPVYPEEWNISAVAGSGWKWLLGPLATGIMYTSEKFRKKIGVSFAGPDMMKQGDNYLDHSWNLHEDGRKFEFSTKPVPFVPALCRCLEDFILPHSMEEIQAENYRLQELALSLLDRDKFTPMIFPDNHRSGIVSLVCKKENPEAICRELQKKNVVCTSRGGYLRLAPHIYNDDDEIVKAMELLNA